MADPDHDEEGGRLPDWLVGVLALETIAVGISLVTPVTPSKTGSTWSPAELFTPDPSYAEKVLASFVVVHLMFAVIGVVAWLWMRWGGP